MKRILGILAVLVLLVVAFFISQMVLPDKPEPVTATNIPAENIKTEPINQPKPPLEEQQAKEKVYSKGGKVLVYSQPAPEILAPLGEIRSGSNINVLGKEKDFYHVKYEEKGEVKEGYIPIWYLDDNKTAVAECDYGYQVLKEDKKGLLYPDGPEIVDLKQGKLLKPFQESGDWVEASILVYDIPAVQNAWVKKDALVSPSKLLPNEGFIPSDAELYFVDEYKDIKNAKPQKEAYPKNIFVIRREGGYAYVGAAGGWTAWVGEKWISYTDKDLK